MSHASKSGWTEVRWSVSVELADELTDLLAERLEGSVLIEIQGDRAELVGAVEQSRDTEGWRDELTRALAPMGSEAPTFRRLDDHDWKNAWREVWKPFRVGPFAIVPRDFAGELRATDQRIVLEPGVAFGTGRHATTRACLLALGELDVQGARVLDAGSGSGLLGVAAALRGAASVEGFDLDPHAVPVAVELARDNGVAARCDFVAAGFEYLSGSTKTYHLVFANIYADVIIERAGALARALEPNGTLVVSGCARERREQVLAALALEGLRPSVEYGRRWRTFVCARS